MAQEAEKKEETQEKPEDKTEEAEEQEESEEESAEEEEEEHGEEEMTPLEKKLLAQKRRANKQSAKDRLALVALKAEIKEKEKQEKLAKMGEVDRLKALIEEGEAKLKASDERTERTAKRAAVISVASTMEFWNPSTAARLIDLSKIEVDAEGNPDEDQVSGALELLKEEQPYLMKTTKESPPGEFGGGATNPAPDKESTPMPKFTSKSEVDRLRQTLEAGIKSGVLTGQAILDMRHRIFDAQRGAAIQAERSGTNRIQRRIKGG